MDRDEVHVRVVVRVQRSHVAPVGAVAVGGARHLVAGEVVDGRVAARDECRDDVAAEVVLGRLVAGVGGQHFHQQLAGEHVVAHRRVDLVGRVGQPHGVLGLLAKRLDRAPVGAGLDDPELIGLRERHPDRRHRHARPAVDVRLHHLPRVHPVDVVGAEHAHVVGPLVIEQVEILVDGVGRAREPARSPAHLRGHRRDVVAQQRRQLPRRRHVAV